MFPIYKSGNGRYTFFTSTFARVPYVRILDWDSRIDWNDRTEYVLTCDCENRSDLPECVQRIAESVFTEYWQFETLPLINERAWAGWYELSDSNWIECFESVDGGVYYRIVDDPEGDECDGGIMDYVDGATFGDFMKFVKAAHGVDIVRRHCPYEWGPCDEPYRGWY